MTAKTKLEQNMMELLNLEEEKLPIPVLSANEIQGLELDNDFERSRKNLASLLEIGTDALTNALYVAKQSDDPDAFQTVSNMIKQLADVNEQVLNLHLKHQKHKMATEEKIIQQTSGPQTVTNNAIFVGNNAELLKLIKNNGVINATTEAE